MAHLSVINYVFFSFFIAELDHKIVSRSLYFLRRRPFAYHLGAVALILVKFCHQLDVLDLVLVYRIDLEQGNHGLMVTHCDFIDRGVLEKAELVYILLEKDAVRVTGHTQFGIQVR